MWTYKTGVWFWGTVLALWLASVLVGLAWAGTIWSESLHAHDGLAAAVTAVLGLIWSWFLELHSRPRP